MEKSENGPPLLALSVDVNENEEISKPYTTLSDCTAETCILGVNKNRACPQIARSDEAEKGDVYGNVDRDVNADKTVLPSQCIHFSDGKMLDFISECPPGIKDNFEKPEDRGSAEPNGFTESAGEVMAGLRSGGGGTEEAPTWSDSVTADGREMNGVLSDGVSPVRTDTARPPPNKRADRHLNSGTAPQCALPGPRSCAAGRESCAQTTGGEDGVLNRTGCLQDMDPPSRTPEPHSGFDDDKMANGGMVVVRKESDSTYEADLHSENVDWSYDADGRNLNEKCQCTPSPASGVREVRLVRGEAFRCEVRHATLSSEAAGSRAGAESVSRPMCRAGKGDLFEPASASQSELSTYDDDDHRRCDVVRRPVTLRTNPRGTGSLSCDATPLGPDVDHLLVQPSGQLDPGLMEAALSPRNTFDASRRQSAPDSIPDGLTVVSDPTSDQVLKQKKYGISDFFARNLFSRKPKESRPPAASAPGWKLFGRVPPRENPPKDSRTIQQETHPDSLTSVSTPNLLSAAEYEARTGKAVNPAHSQHGRRKNLEFEPLSTTALILEDRPANLPAKSAEEAQRHRQEYDEMVAEAKKREMKEAQRKKKLMKERFRQEDNIANAMVIWNTEILPNWKSVRHTRRVRELWWQGVPPSVRGRVWSLAIGNELNITPELYEIFLSRAKEKWRSFSETGSENETEDTGASLADRESSLDLIKLDISRTFPYLFIFQKGGPYHDILHSVLGAYTCYRPDVGYVQGMSFIAAVLILNLEEADAFIAFANLLNKPCQMAFFRVDHDLMLKYFAAFEVFFEENLPRLFSHFKTCNLTPDLYLIDWIFTLYSKSLPLDVACRVWDIFCRDGEECLFRTALGVLRLYEEVLLRMDFIHIAQFLTRLPDDIAPDRLFSCIGAVQMLSGNRKWTQVFSTLMKDNKEMEKNNSPALKS